MDVAKMEAAVRAFLDALGERFAGDDLERTPQRVARAWSEDLLAGYAIDPATEMTWSPVPEGAGPVVVRRVRFASVCVHHLLPFFGDANVAYLPGDRLAGLSKIGRVVDAHARRLQTQERLTAGIVRTLDEALAARGAIAVLRAEHTCMTCRGVRKERSRMLTMASAGLYQDDPAARREILELLENRRDESGSDG
jgi:GTP cyclohydrolase I